VDDLRNWLLFRHMVSLKTRSCGWEEWTRMSNDKTKYSSSILVCRKTLLYALKGWKGNIYIDKISTKMDAWQTFFSSCNLEERLFFVIGTWLVVNGTFWGSNLIFYFLYQADAFPQYRVIPGAFPPKDIIQECIRANIFGNGLLLPVILYFAYPFFLSCGMSVTGPLPTVGTILRDMVVNVAVNDTMFYWCHRILHHPSIYKYIHKHHHRFNHSIGIAAQFAHPIEDVLANIAPTIVGCLVMQSHLFTFWLWLYIRLWETVYVHSGYSFPYSPFNLFPAIQGGSERHYFHHSHNQGCYGSFTCFWDWICGTDAAFNEYQAQKKAAKGEKKGK
jgi:sterol desaturase/sphingolipid hydroxylase (fatty acid hydroxylase superfamily)